MEADATPAASTTPSGLTTQEAAELLAKYGPNSVAEKREHPLRMLWSKFWARFPGCSKPRSCWKSCCTKRSRRP